MKQSFMKGAAILGFATLFCKILGAIYRVPYQNITGNEGMFVYQQVYPLYSTLLAMATAGFPVAISKLVSERVAAGDHQGAKRVFHVSLVILILIGIIFFSVLFFSANQLAEWMGNRELLTLPIQSVSFALLIVPIVAAIRGFFQGQQNMFPTAISQTIEQFIRVCTIIFLSWYFIEFGFGIVYAGAGAVFGAVTGAIASVVFLFAFLYKKGKYKVKEEESNTSPETIQKIIKQVLLLSLPICLGALVIPLFSLVDSFTVANLLTRQFGMDEAITLKGVFDRGQPLIQFASFFATAISLSIVPAIAEARALKNDQEACERAKLAIRMTWLTGLPAAIGLSIIAMPTNVMLFKDQQGSVALSILAFTALFLTLNLTSTGILQGYGKVYLPVIYLFIGVGIKLIANLIFIPLFDIRGAAMATVISYGISTFLNFLALRKIGVTLRASGFLKKLGMAVIWMSMTTFGAMYLSFWITSGLTLRLSMTLTALFAVMVGFLSFVWAIFRFQVLTVSDLEKIPKLKKKIAPILHKWRLLRS
ncbi:putative polysaccharide biosynthesis protein [Thermoflavimicrobium daqui]|uniref:Polysaccharide biosynthesis protein n=1 Tax=Thermoflavimicrobium daqui TaxID=2137476 RepID=A0A364K2W7_9BACL|nr:polysaccharide biosynthesis protein [Thermoflavimicrobium daqui]RAL23180.1 polysaccharide biosynthesis protein [Thermoflavimicrobium daqui]